MKYTSYETAFNRYVRKARKAAKGLSGYDRAKAVEAYFLDDETHPHVRYTFNKLYAARSSDRQFAIDLLNTLADLAAKNTQGWHHGSLPNEPLEFVKNIGGCSINDWNASLYMSRSSKFVIQIEKNNGKHCERDSIVFSDEEQYNEWIQANFCDLTGGSLAYQIIVHLSD